jgi:hypothetical protein
VWQDAHWFFVSWKSCLPCDASPDFTMPTAPHPLARNATDRIAVTSARGVRRAVAV